MEKGNRPQVLALWSLIPPLVAGVLLFCRRTALTASLVALGAGIILTVFVPSFHLSPTKLTDTILTLAGPSLEVVLIMLGGIWFDRAMQALRLQEPLGDWLLKLSNDPVRRILLMVLGVTPFIESVTGFGVGVVLAAPLLMRMGFSPRQAAILGLLGFVAVPWGALAPGTLVAAVLTGTPFQDVGVASALLSFPVFLFIGGFALAYELGIKTALNRMGELLIIAFSLWVGVVGANLFSGTPTAGALGSLVAIVVLLARVRFVEGHRPHMNKALGTALAPYGFLLAFLLSGRLLVMTGVSGGDLERLLISPATWLWVTSAGLSMLVHRRGAIRWDHPLREALRRWWSVALSTLAFLALGGLMTASGMSDALAEQTAGLGRAYAFFIPWIGGLGGYLTGSNTGANAMFAVAQAHGAGGAGLSVLWAVAGQNVAASLLTMASPPRIALAATVVGDDAVASSIFRPVLLADAMVLAAMSLILFGLAG